MNNVRNAALHLYSLHSKDREWVLERLPENMQTSLIPLIDELQLLNISQESISDYSDTLFIEQEESGRKDLLIKIRLIENVELGIVKQCLSDESPEVIASIINLMSRRWQKIFLEYSNYDCKNVVYDYLTSKNVIVSDKVSYSLINALAGQINSVENDEQFCSDEVDGSGSKQGRRLWRR